MNHIADKSEFYALSRALKLGNRLTQWTPSEFEQLYLNNGNTLPKIVGIRHVGGAFGVGKSFRAPRDEAYKYLKQHRGNGVLFDEAANDAWMTFQGEVMPDEKHLYLRCSTRACHQRELWASGVYEHVWGLRAKCLLERYMDIDSRECLHEIMRSYHFPVVEFACFDRPVGILRTNTIFWEVRTDY
jgi:hypothetical protein